VATRPNEFRDGLALVALYRRAFSLLDEEARLRVYDIYFIRPDGTVLELERPPRNIRTINIDRIGENLI